MSKLTQSSPMKQVAIRMPVEMLWKIDAIVAERYGQVDRTSVMRELMAEALALRARKHRS